MGIERLVLLLEQHSVEQKIEDEIDIFLAGLGPAASERCFQLMHRLRKAGLRMDMDLEGKSLKSQMKQADKAGAAYVLIVGDQELEQGKGVLRNMRTKEQSEIEIDTTAITAAIN